MVTIITKQAMHYTQSNVLSISLSMCDFSQIYYVGSVLQAIWHDFSKFEKFGDVKNFCKRVFFIT